MLILCSLQGRWWEVMHLWSSLRRSRGTAGGICGTNAMQQAFCQRACLPCYLTNDACRKDLHVLGFEYTPR